MDTFSIFFWTDIFFKMTENPEKPQLIENGLLKSEVKSALEYPQYFWLGYRRKILQALIIASLFFLGILTIYNVYQYIVDPKAQWVVRNLISDVLAIVILSIIWHLSRKGNNRLASNIFILFICLAIIECYSIQKSNQAFLVSVLPISLSSFTMRPWASIPMVLVSIGLYTYA